MKKKIINFPASTAYVLVHGQVVFLLVLIWNAYQQILAEGAYGRIVRKHALTKLIIYVFHERHSALGRR